MIDKFEIVGPHRHVQIREKLSDGSFFRRVLSPGDDYTTEPLEVQTACKQAWTQAVLSAYAQQTSPP